MIMKKLKISHSQNLSTHLKNPTTGYMKSHIWDKQEMCVVANMHTQYHMTVTSSIIYISTNSVTMVTTVFILTSGSKHVSCIQLHDNANVKRCVESREDCCRHEQRPS